MLPLKLTVGHETGFVFEGNIPEAIVFVPEAYALAFGDGSIIVNHAGFLLSGWAEKSIRFSSAGDGYDRVFPVDTKPVYDPEDPRVISFVARLKHAYTVGLQVEHC